MHFTKLLLGAIAVVTPTITYAQEPEPADVDQDVAKAYASKGTFEVGGSIGAAISSHVATVTASPTVGYFIADRIELSGMFTFAYSRTEDEATGRHMSSKAGALIFEPSYHHPISDDLLAVGGLGVGVGYDGDNWDFELIPSVGLEIVTSRANVITPAVRVPILFGESHGSDGDVGAGVGLILEVGITTTW